MTPKQKNALFIFGTRPEAIKLAPVIKEMEACPEFKVTVCVTGQHRELLDQVLELFSIYADFDLNIMKPSQTLYDITAESLRNLEDVLQKQHPDLILVQGDTTSAFVGALAGFYAKVPVGHIEAGLRTDNRFEPYPEEMNRRLISRLADFHFAPTQTAVDALKREGVSEHVYRVGNTVVDAVRQGTLIMAESDSHIYESRYGTMHPDRKLLLVTAHRRENLGPALERICNALKEIVERFPEAEVIYPLHPNPQARAAALSQLANHPRIHLIEAFPYPDLLWLLKHSFLVLTDSGGLQEEAPSLGKPVLVLRETTERPEGVASGNAVLVGSDPEIITREATRILSNKEVYARMSQATNIYGDGRASKRIVEILKREIV